MQYYLNTNGEQSGPFDLEALKLQKILADTLVWREDFGDTWKKASEVAELSDFITKLSPPSFPPSSQQTPTTNTVVINQTAPKEEKKRNRVGVAGFVLALVALCFCWTPGLNFILWLLGLIFSFVGVFKTPKGLSIAGLSISLIGIILIVIMFTIFNFGFRPSSTGML